MSNIVDRGMLVLSNRRSFQEADTWRGGVVFSPLDCLSPGKNLAAREAFSLRGDGNELRR
jgi:hypothetical protein